MHPKKRLADVDTNFPWADVDCFYRPQAMVCDFLCPGSGEFYLYLTSAYKMWGTDGYFNSPASKYFPFLTAVMPKRAGLSFNVHRADRDNRISSVLRGLLKSGNPVIVPTNVRSFSAFEASGKAEAAHYFMVHGYDDVSDSFIVCDNLRSGATSFTFEDIEVPADLLQSMADLYIESHLETQLPTPHREPDFWMLQILPDAAMGKWERNTDVRRPLFDFLELASLPHTDAASHETFDSRHIAYIQVCKVQASQRIFRSAMREYLAEANFTTVHLSLTIRMLERLGWKGAAQLFLELEAYRKAATILRSNLLTTCIMGSAVPDDFEKASKRLFELAIAIRSDIAQQIRQSEFSIRNEESYPALGQNSKYSL